MSTRALVIGLGSMGKRRVRNLRALGIQDVSGFDRRADRCQEAREKYGIHIHTDLSAALRGDADVVIISLPPDLHVEHAMAAARAGKHYFTEASVVDDGLAELIRLTEEKKLVGFPSCTMRFFPGPKRVREFLKAGKIGRPLFWQYQTGQYLPDWHPWEKIQDFYVSKRETGGCREIVPFELAWLTQVFGEVAEVDGRRSRISDLPVDIDDVYMLQIRHRTGVLGQLTVDVLSRTAVRDLRVTGQEGTLEWDSAQNSIRVYHAASQSWTEESLASGTIEKAYINPEEPYIEEMRAFLGCVTERRAPEYSLQEDQKILDVLYASEKSSDGGRRLDLGR